MPHVARLHQGWCGQLLAILAGTLVTLSLAPFNMWICGLLSVVLIAWLLHGLSPRQAALRGWFYGLGLFGSGTSWVYVSIHVYGYAPMPLAIFLTVLFSAGLALFCSITGYLYARFIRDLPGGDVLGFAAIWTLGEWLRSWLLTGFPWLYLGYAHLDSPLAGWAPVGGVLLISFILAYSGAMIARSIRQQQFPSLHGLSLAVLWLSGYGLQQAHWTEASDKPPLTIAMVQANIGQDVKWRRDQYWPTLNLYNSMSQPLWSQADVVIWPEAAVPGYYDNAQTYLERIEKFATDNDSSLILGIPHRETINGKKHAYNSIRVIGNGEGLYHKQRLVPFGEYVPLEGMLRGLIQFFDLPMSQFSSGDRNTLLMAKNTGFAPFICYEIVYPDLVASWLPEAEVLITISNDAWFGNSIGPLQHMQIAQMRALETGRYLIRSTGNGVTAVVNPKGQVEAQGEQFKQLVINGQVQAMTGATPFAMTGSWTTVGLCVLIWIVLAGRRTLDARRYIP